MSVERSGRKDWSRRQLRGIENLLVPSFDASLRELDEEGIRLDVRQSMRHGFCSSLCALDAGLTPAEQRRMVEIAVAEAAGRIAIGATLIGSTLDRYIALRREAEEAGATHVLLVWPHGFAPSSDDELVAFVQRVAAGSTLGICLLMADRFAFHRLHPSGVPMAALERLADLDAVFGLELAGFDAGMLLECCERFADRLLVTTPNLAMLPLLRTGLPLQWSASWAAEGLQSPEKPHAVRFLQLLLEDKGLEAMQTYWTFAPALGAMLRVAASFAHTGAQHWPLVKYQQWLSGGNGGMTRQPVMRLFARDMQAIRAGLRAAGIECADPDEEFFTGRSMQRSRR